MNSEQAFDIWAPPESPWSPWVKPILFASEPDWDGTHEPDLPEIADLGWLAEPRWVQGYRETGKPATRADTSTAFVLDLPGATGVAWGVALARRGFRPIPLYNALPGGSPAAAQPLAKDPAFAFAPLDRSALVDVWSILHAMRRATAILRELALPPDRPPAFLLDANRRLGSGPLWPGRFDNRSISLPTDFPSALFLRTRGIERVVLIRPTTELQEDLAHTLFAWQQGGISILAKSLVSEGPPAPIEVARPSMFRAMLYRCLVTIGLRRHPLGGFGGTIPVPSSA